MIDIPFTDSPVASAAVLSVVARKVGWVRWRYHALTCLVIADGVRIFGPDAHRGPGVAITLGMHLSLSFVIIVLACLILSARLLDR